MGFEAFKSKVSSLAKDAVAMGKDVAQTTKFNFEIGAAEDKIKDVHCRIGKYVSANNLLADNATIAALHAEIFDLNGKISDLQEKLQDIKSAKSAPAPEATLAEEIPVMQIPTDETTNV